MNPIIPTIFAHNKKEFSLRFRKLVSISRNLQIDFMDGKFVPAKSVQLEDIPNLKRYKNNFEAHLMVKNPLLMILELKRKGFKKIIVHVQSNKIEKTIETINKQRLVCYLAINPEVFLDTLPPILKKVEGVLFMGVHPGREHQEFMKLVYKKIKLLRKTNSKIKIQVDGGATERVVKKLAKLGVDYINSGSLISDAESPKQQFIKLNAIFNKHKR